ncbi:MAG: hypothetical protein QM692_02325 [Thermomicrobiales bacterium]
MRPTTPHYATPYHWWGPGPQPAAPLTLAALLRAGTLDTAQAAFLWAALAQRRSLTVVGGPSGLGKSTLLHALLPLLRATTRRVFLRGCYETFAFAADGLPTGAVMLVNEISPHLPIYLWGPAVRRTLELCAGGVPLLATAHGHSVVEFVASLTGSPLRIPPALVAGCDLVALMQVDAAGTRCLREIWRLSATTQGGVDLRRIDPSSPGDGFDALDIMARRGRLETWLSENGAAGSATEALLHQP